MAVTSTTVRYNVVGTDNTSKAFRSAGDNASKMGSKISKAADIAKKAALGIGVGAIAAGVEALKQAKDFQSQMTLLVTAGGESQKALGMVAAGVKKVATQTGTSVEQLGEGMYTIEKAGFRGANGLKILTVSAEAAKAENVDLATMTNAVTSAMTSYHLKAGQSTKITNEIVAAAGAAKTNMSEFAGALSTVLPIASAAGISFAQIGGAIATLTNHGTSAEEATQELANTIRSLQAPNSVAVNEMAQLGISSNDVATKLGKRGLTGTLELLSETVLKKMGKSGTVLLNTFNSSKIAAQDAGTMFKSLPSAAQKVAQAYENGKLSLNDYRKALKGLPADQAALAQQWATTENKSKGFNSALRAGGQPAQTYTAAIKAMTGGATGLNTTLQLTGENTGRFTANVKTVTDASKHAGSNISTWAKTQKTFNVQWDRFKEGLQVAAINAGTKLLGPLTALVGFMNDHVLPAAAKVGGAISGMFHDLSPAVAGAKKVVSAFFSAISPKAHSATRQISGIFGGIDSAVKSAGQKVGSFLSGLSGQHLKPTGQASTLQQIIDVQTGIDPTAEAKAGKRVHDALQRVFGGVPGELQGFQKNVSDFWSTLQGSALKPTGQVSSVQGIIDQQTGIKPTDAAKSGKKLHDTLSGIFNGGNIDTGKLGVTLGAVVVAAFTGLVKYTPKIAAAIIGLFAKLPWTQIGKAAVVAFVPFVIGFVNNIGTALIDETIHHPLDLLEFVAALIPVGKVAGVVLKVLDKALPESKLIVPLVRLVLGPFEKAGSVVEKGVGKLFGGLGKIVGTGIKDAFTKEFPDTAAWIGEFFWKITTKPFDGAKNLITSASERVGGGIITGIRKGAEGITTVMIRIVKFLLSPFKDTGSWLLSGGRNLMSGLLSGIGKGWGPVSRWLGEVLGKVLSNFRGVGSWLLTRGRDLFSGLFDGIGRGWGPVSRWLGGILSRIVSPFRGAGSWLVSHGRDIFVGLYGGMSRGWGSVWKWFTGVPRKFGGANLGWATTLVNKGGALIQGLFDGIVGRLGVAKDWVRAHLFNPIKNAVISLFEIKSPSKVMKRLGGHVMNGFIAGMLLHDPAALAKNMVGSVPKVLESIVQQGFVKVGQLSKKGVQALQSVGYNVGQNALDKFGLGGGSGDTRAHNQNAAANQAYAKSAMHHFGFNTGSDFAALLSLWNGESGWNQNAANPTSSAYGIPQFLDSTWGAYTYPKTADPNKQIVDGLQYIKAIYGNPRNAFAQWSARSPHWYGSGLVGGIFNKPTVIGVGERGPERVDVTPLNGKRGGGTITADQIGNAVAYAVGEYFTNASWQMDRKGVVQFVNDGNKRGKDSRLVGPRK